MLSEGLQNTGMIGECLRKQAQVWVLVSDLIRKPQNSRTLLPKFPNWYHDSQGTSPNVAGMEPMANACCNFEFGINIESEVYRSKRQRGGTNLLCCSTPPSSALCVHSGSKMAQTFALLKYLCMEVAQSGSPQPQYKSFIPF